jgi:hypothetical protein
MTNHRITTTAAVILSLAAASAPAASARPADFVPPTKQAPAVGYSRPDKSPIAVNSPATSSGSSAETASAPGVSSDSAPTPAELIAAQRAAASPSASLDRFALINVHKIPLATASRNSDPRPFPFAGAAIGAGGVLLAMLGLVGGLVISRHRPRRTRRTTTLPSAPAARQRIPDA